jgi:hypothetical protein
MADYLAAGVAEREKTVRLRALREAKRAADDVKRDSSGVDGADATKRVRVRRRPDLEKWFGDISDDGG